MKKILILTNNDVGLYKFRKELIEKLVIENEVFISLPHGEYVSNFENMNCKFINTPINRRGTNPIKDFMLLMHYRKILKDVKPDLVLTYTIKPNVYGGLACSIRNIPYIANITGLGTAVENKGLMQKISVTLYKIGLRKASTIFFQNKFNKDFFEAKKMLPRKYDVLPGSGVNLEHFSILEYPSDEKIVFLFVGRIMKEKGIDQYLEAAKFIKKKYPKTEFHILGTCDEIYADKLNMMSKEGTIKYHGMQSDVREFHKISHCTIHPSYYPEGMSNVLLESAASGRPVITTNRPGCKEVVDEGISGFIFKEKSTSSLIEKIEDFIALKYQVKKNMGMFGRLKVEKEFDRSIVIDAYMNEINKV